MLAPTRELAKQVENEIFITAATLATVCVCGDAHRDARGETARGGYHRQYAGSGARFDQSGNLNLGEIEFVVLDEADQMLNVGFEEDVEKILQDCPRRVERFYSPPPCRAG